MKKILLTLGFISGFTVQAFAASGSPINLKVINQSSHDLILSYGGSYKWNKLGDIQKINGVLHSGSSTVVMGHIADSMKSWEGEYDDVVYFNVQPVEAPTHHDTASLYKTYAIAHTAVENSFMGSSSIYNVGELDISGKGNLQPYDAEYIAYWLGDNNYIGVGIQYGLNDDSVVPMNIIIKDDPNNHGGIHAYYQNMTIPANIYLIPKFTQHKRSTDKLYKALFNPS